MMINFVGEDTFLLDKVKSGHRILEWGSGASTIELGRRCKELVSIEHQKDWYDNVSSLYGREGCTANLVYLLRPPNLPYKEGGHDGTEEEFRDYVRAPNNYGPFDIIFIDGRARVECARAVNANRLFHKETLVFVHDFVPNVRPEYNEIIDKHILQFVDSFHTMWMFKPYDNPV